MTKAVAWVMGQPRGTEWRAADLAAACGVTLVAAQHAVKRLRLFGVVAAVGENGTVGRRYTRLLDGLPIWATGARGDPWTFAEHEALVMSLERGLTLREAAAQLGRSLDAVRAQVGRAREAVDLAAREQGRADAAPSATRFEDVDDATLARELKRLKAGAKPSRWTGGCAAYICAEMA